MALPAKTLNDIPEWRADWHDPGTHGHHRVPQKLVKKKLGGRAWTVWWHCLCWSNMKRTGYYNMHPENTLKQINNSSFMLTPNKKGELPAQMTPRGLRKVFCKLYKAGLLGHAAIPKEGGKWRNYRKVYGWYAGGEEAGKKTIMVPAKTALWLRAPETRGGARPGAGRKLGGKNKPKPAQTVFQNGGTAFSKRGQPVLPAARRPASVSYGNTPRQAAAPVSSQKQQPEAAAPTPVEATKAGPTEGYVPQAPGLTESKRADGTAVLRGNMTSGGRPPPPGFGGVPRFPGPTVMLPATVPGPPRLPAGLDDDAAVDWLLKAYRGAVGKRTKKPCWVLARKGEARKSKHWPALVAAARMLEENEWSPGGWVMFSIDVWAEARGPKATAPLHWVFSTSRMEEKGEWFMAEGGSYSAPRVIYNDFAKTVLSKYQQMQMDLIRSGAVAEPAVREVVARHWPGDTYRQAVNKANSRTQEDQVLINQRIARGEWVWV